MRDISRCVATDRILFDRQRFPRPVPGKRFCTMIFGPDLRCRTAKAHLFFVPLAERSGNTAVFKKGKDGKPLPEIDDQKFQQAIIEYKSKPEFQSLGSGSGSAIENMGLDPNRFEIVQ